jgi:hypothetical protein
MFVISGVGIGGAFYAVTNPVLNPYGNMEYSVSGHPIPYGRGSFSIILLGVPYNGEFIGSVTVTDGNAIITSGQGTYQDLLDTWHASLVGAPFGALVDIQFFDVRLNSTNTLQAKMKFPQLLGNYSGASLVNVRCDFYNIRFIEITYESGPYIPGDPLPPPDPDLTYGWGNGGWGAGFWGRGEGE